MSDIVSPAGISGEGHQDFAASSGALSTSGVSVSAAAQEKPVIEMHDIYKGFFLGTDHELTVLKGVNLAIPRGEFVSIVGSSGSGKSTLMNIIGLLDRPTSGSYILGDSDISQVNDNEAALIRSLSIGFVFQNFNLVGRTDALKNVELPMMYAGMGRAQRRERALSLLELVDMTSRMHHQPNELSGGQKQRVAIARAMANDPDIILADEPTGALDTATGHMVMDLFHRLHREQGKTIVLITHNPELAEQTQRIFTMVDGVLSDGVKGAGIAPGQTTSAHGGTLPPDLGTGVGVAKRRQTRHRDAAELQSSQGGVQ